MERHFRCVACGKCCFGFLPLTLQDALRYANAFPLALVWTTVPYGTRAFSVSANMGTVLKSRGHSKIAVTVTPTSYVPVSLPCPKLTSEGLCSIHENKPLRCQTMPFYPYREERDQTDLLTPRKEWACDVSKSACVVYRNHNILDRIHFDQERRALLEQAPIMRTYVEYVLKYMPWVLDRLFSTAQGGNVVTSLSSFCTAIRFPNVSFLASQQLPIFLQYAKNMANQPEFSEYQQQYSGWAKEMEYLASLR
ncbi:Zinc/iron-chelating domain-containing protein [Gammaproteobacteria bacterium]